jgi:hypothetical protein
MVAAVCLVVLSLMLLLRVALISLLLLPFILGVMGLLCMVLLPGIVLFLLPPVENATIGRFVLGPPLRLPCSIQNHD